MGGGKEIQKFCGHHIWKLPTPLSVHPPTDQPQILSPQFGTRQSISGDDGRRLIHVPTSNYRQMRGRSSSIREGGESRKSGKGNLRKTQPVVSSVIVSVSRLALHFHSSTIGESSPSSSSHAALYNSRNSQPPRRSMHSEQSQSSVSRPLHSSFLPCFSLFNPPLFCDEDHYQK